jgi:hypothetical protein
MKYLFVLLLLQFTLNAYADEPGSCEVSSTEEPPFYVSDEYLQGDKVYENLRSIENEGGPKKYIPRGSIVYTPPELFDVQSSREYRVPVEVLSTSDSDLVRTLSKSKYYDSKQKRRYAKKDLRAKVQGISGKERAKKGDRGFIDRRALRQAGKYTFIVKSDTAVFKSPNGSVLQDNNLRLKYNAKEKTYQVNRCCEENPDPDQDILLCYQHHIYEMVSEDGEVVDSFSINPSCGIFKEVLPIPNSDIHSIGKILSLTREAQVLEGPLSSLGVENLEIIPKKNSWSGSRLRNEMGLSLVKFPIDNKTRLGPYNSYHYNPDEGSKSTINSDIFIEPMAACTFMQVLKEYQKECKGAGCQVQFGDMYHPNSWMGHKSHGAKNCIDIRPQRKKDDLQANGLKHGWGRYSQDKTESLIKLLVKAGGEPIYFNDPKILKKYQKKDYLEEIRPDVSKWDWNRKPRKLGGHDNHIHVCFPKDSKDAKKACKSGL